MRLAVDSEEKLHRLPYSFAKNNGVVVGEMKEDEILIYHLANASLNALAEVQRLLQCKLHLEKVDEKTFQQHLAHTYQSKSSCLKIALNPLAKVI